MDKNKVKKNYLGKLKKIVASHVYDLGKKIVEDAESSAEDNHEIKLGVHKRKNDIVKEVVELNSKVKNYIKATKDEVTEVCKEGSRQAIMALKNDPSSNNELDDDDEFFKSLDIDLDDMDSDDWDDVLSDVGDDDIGEESVSDIPMRVAKMSNDDISAAVMLFISSVQDEDVLSAIKEETSGIMNVINNTKSSIVDEVTNTKSTGKLDMVKHLIEDIDSEMVPSISVEDIEENGIVVEVIPTELPTKIIQKDDLMLKCKVRDTVKLFLDRCAKIASTDNEIIAIVDMFDSKIQAVVNYLSTSAGLEPVRITNAIYKCIPPCVPYNVGVAFYLGLLPDDVISEGSRLVNIYYNKIYDKEEN